MGYFFVRFPVFLDRLYYFEYFYQILFLYVHLIYYYFFYFDDLLIG